MFLLCRCRNWQTFVTWVIIYYSGLISCWSGETYRSTYWTLTWDRSDHKHHLLCSLPVYKWSLSLSLSLSVWSCCNSPFSRPSDWTTTHTDAYVGLNFLLVHRFHFWSCDSRLTRGFMYSSIALNLWKWYFPLLLTDRLRSVTPPAAHFRQSELRCMRNYLYQRGSKSTACGPMVSLKTICFNSWIFSILT